MKTCKMKIKNSKGLTFFLQFRPLAKTLEISCDDASDLGFVSEVENVTKDLKLEEIECAPMGMVYKCNSYKDFEKVTQAISAI